jgi:glycosyltransferase involved in cell wall biosynthesis
LHLNVIEVTITPSGEKVANLDTHAVIIPTYNERENIGLLVESIVGLEMGSRVIVVDDNSPDGTGELADELAARHDSVRVIHRTGKLGLGTAHIAGMKAALSDGMACILALRVYQLAEQSLWFDERNP